MYLRLAAAVAALAAGAAGIVVAVSLLQSVPGPPKSVSTSAAPSATVPARSVPGGRIPTPESGDFPSPPPGAVVLSRAAGDHALGLAVKPGLVRVSILRPEGGGEAGEQVSLQFGSGYYVPADPCGPGCYQARVKGVPVSPVTVRFGGGAYRFALPKLPARDGSAIVAKAAGTWNALDTLVWHETLASSPTNRIVASYTAVAPDKLAYTIRDKSAAVIIGKHRWDRETPTGPWRESEQDPPVRQPQPFWERAIDAHLIGTGTVSGRPVSVVTFFDPTTPAWFKAYVDRTTHRTLRLEMIAASHFMHDVYGPFNSPVELAPPT